MTIRRQPIDFLVEERPSQAFLSSLRPHGGPRCAHAVYRLTKESLTTPDAAQRLARSLRARPDSASYAGLKDKHARTTQLVSVLVSGPVPESVEDTGWTATRCGWADSPILSDAIEGNRFTIVVRDLTSEACNEMTRRASILREAGHAPEPSDERSDADGPGATRPLLIVNYFGDQRFGSARHGQGFAARPLIAGDFEGALRLAIGTPARKDSGPKRVFTRVCAAKWGRWSEMLAELPRSPDRAPIEVLASGGSAQDAFAALPRFTQLMCVEAYQSHLWNQTARRLAEMIASSASSTPLRADDDFGEMVFPVAGAAGPEWRALIVPLLAPKTMLEGPWADAARDVLAAEGIELSRLRVPGLRKPFFGEAPRPLFVRAEAFSISDAGPDELSSRPDRLKRTVCFDLPRGAYATVVLRALGQ